MCLVTVDNGTSHHRHRCLMIAAQRTGAILKQLHRLIGGVGIKMVRPAEKILFAIGCSRSVICRVVT